MMEPVANRPGLSAISYRIGTYGSFFAAMKARLSSASYPGLAGLRSRAPGDFTIALLDAWASVADVLTFYEERIANEGYVRTATERLSVLELGRTVGYALRPGVAATAYLAYTMDATADSVLPAGTLVQTTPGQGQLPQAFETSADLHATGAWNTLGVRTQQPQPIDISSGSPPAQVAFQGTNLNLSPDDVLLFIDGSASGGAAPAPVAARVESVDVQKDTSLTVVTLAALGVTPPPPSSGTPPSNYSSNGQATSLLSGYERVHEGLLKRPGEHPPNSLRMAQSVAQTFGADHDAVAKALTVFHPELADTLFPALAQATATPASAVDVYVFRISTLPFGANAPLQFKGFDPTVRTAGPPRHNVPDYEEWELAKDELPILLWLDRFYPNLAPDTWIVVRVEDESPVVATIEAIRQIGRAQYGISGSPAVLRLSKPWHAHAHGQTIGFLRATNVYAQSEQLPLAQQAVAGPVGGAKIDLDGIYDGLSAGRWVIVTGTRSDVPGAPAAELMMIAATAHVVDPTLPGDTLHTQLTLSNDLAYSYDRSTVQIYGNVVQATNGQTWNETLGSGSGSLALQRFTLKQKPLTYVAASSAAGVATTLQVSVNGVPWTEYDSLDAMGPTDRGYVTRTDNAQNTSVLFGDGVHGSRLPTGVENVAATYRAGIGQSGNADASQITLLASRPLGVKAVTNPIAASGGADPESADQGRSNAPLATAALDRIVSVDDYASVARTFAGVAKAMTVQFAGAPPIVHVTVAADDDAAVAPKSDLIVNLTAALSAQGDPQVGLDIAQRSLIILVLSANVVLESGNQWEAVEPAIRTALLDGFGFDARDLGQPVYLSEVVAAVQGVGGVASVHIDVFEGISETAVVADFARLSEQQGDVKLEVVALPPRRGADGKILPAQLAIFEPTLPEAIVLTEAAP